MEPLAQRLGLRELKQGSSKTFALKRGIYRNIFEQKPPLGYRQNQDSDDASAALCNCDSPLTNHFFVILGHGTRRYAHALHVVLVRGVHALRNRRSIPHRGRSQ